MFHRLIALDIDGTLLSSKGEVTQPTAEAVRHAGQLGAWLAIASGRNVLGVRNINRLLGLDTWYISSGGAEVGHAQTRQVLQQCALAAADARKVIDCARQFRAGIFLETAGQVCWEGPREYRDQALNVIGLPITAVADVEAMLDENPLKLTLMQENPTLKRIENTLRPQVPDLNLTYSMANYMEVTRQGVDKGAALSRLAAYLQVPRAQVAAIGDGENDLPMFRAAGLSIAMGNAPEAVRRAADWVAPSNDQDGIVWALSQIEAYHAPGA